MKPPIVYRKTAKDKEVMAGLQSFKGHKEIAERLKKTLYYGKHPKTDRPSLPMTELAVQIFARAVPEGLGQIGMDYASSVSRNACISPCSMILAMAYIERVRRRSPDYLMHVTSSDLFLVSMMVASKFLYDEGEDEEVFNDEWAKAANLENKEVNQLERKFLAAIDWNVYGNSDLFEELLCDVEYKVALQKSKDRGWCTYTDLLILSEKVKAKHCWPFLDALMKVVSACSIAYAASIVVMVAAALMTNHIKSQVAQMVSRQESPLDTTNLALRLETLQNQSGDLAQWINLPRDSCLPCNYSSDEHIHHYPNSRIDQQSEMLNPYSHTLTSGSWQLPSPCSNCRERHSDTDHQPFHRFDPWFSFWNSYNKQCYASVDSYSMPFLKSPATFKTLETLRNVGITLTPPDLSSNIQTVCIPAGIAYS